MAETGRLTSAAPGAVAVTLVRAAIIVFALIAWEALARSGLLFRDVVPPLFALRGALVAVLTDPTFYRHLGVTAGEIAIALAIGGLCGLAVGIALGGSRFLGRAFEP